MDGAYRQSIRGLSALLVLLGVALVVSTIARGGGPLSLGVVVGVCLAAFGTGRILLTPRAGRP